MKKFVPLSRKKYQYWRWARVYGRCRGALSPEALAAIAECLP